jgi:hypothetical protein
MFLQLDETFCLLLCTCLYVRTRACEYIRMLFQLDETFCLLLCACESMYVRMHIRRVQSTYMISEKKLRNNHITLSPHSWCCNLLICMHTHSIRVCVFTCKASDASLISLSKSTGTLLTTHLMLRPSAALLVVRHLYTLPKLPWPSFRRTTISRTHSLRYVYGCVCM